MLHRISSQVVRGSTCNRAFSAAVLGRGEMMVLAKALYESSVNKTESSGSISVRERGPDMDCSGKDIIAQKTEVFGGGAAALWGAIQKKQSDPSLHVSYFCSDAEGAAFVNCGRQLHLKGDPAATVVLNELDSRFSAAQIALGTVEKLLFASTDRAYIPVACLGMVPSLLKARATLPSSLELWAQAGLAHRAAEEMDVSVHQLTGERMISFSGRIRTATREHLDQLNELRRRGSDVEFEVLDSFSGENGDRYVLEFGDSGYYNPDALGILMRAAEEVGVDCRSERVEAVYHDGGRVVAMETDRHVFSDVPFMATSFGADGDTQLPVYGLALTGSVEDGGLEGAYSNQDGIHVTVSHGMFRITGGSYFFEKPDEGQVSELIGILFQAAYDIASDLGSSFPVRGLESVRLCARPWEFDESYRMGRVVHYTDANGDEIEGLVRTVGGMGYGASAFAYNGEALIK